MTSKHRFFAAESATYLLLKLLEAKGAENFQTVVLPDYNCHHFYRPFIELGIQTRRMPPEEYLSFLQNTNCRNFEFDTVLVVHYFGQKSEYIEFEQNVLVIEDCSHITNSIRPTDINKAYLYSPYKHLYMARCGMLYLPKDLAMPIIRYELFTLKSLIYYFKTALKIILLFNKTESREVKDICCPAYEMDIYGNVSLWRMLLLKFTYFYVSGLTRVIRRLYFSWKLEDFGDLVDPYIIPVETNSLYANKDWPDLFCNDSFEGTMMYKSKIRFHKMPSI